LEIQVDQSNKVESPHDTVLACSNGRRHAIVIQAGVKRDILESLRQRGVSRKRASVYLFAAGLFLLLRDVADQVDWIMIDEEYPGYAADIKAILLRMLRRAGKKVDAAVITFSQVGKSSPAHDLALRVSRRKRPPDHNVTPQELRKALGLTK
jgi:hypothetical protein